MSRLFLEPISWQMNPSFAKKVITYPPKGPMGKSLSDRPMGSVPHVPTRFQDFRKADLLTGPHGFTIRYNCRLSAVSRRISKPSPRGHSQGPVPPCGKFFFWGITFLPLFLKVYQILTVTCPVCLRFALSVAIWHLTAIWSVRRNIPVPGATSGHHWIPWSLSSTMSPF